MALQQQILMDKYLMIVLGFLMIGIPIAFESPTTGEFREQPFIPLFYASIGGIIAGVIMNYVFVNKAAPNTNRVSRSSSAGKSQKLEQYEKQYLSRLEKEPAKEETKKVSRPRRVQAKKSKSVSELEKYEKRYLARLEKQSQTNADITDEE